MRGRAHPFWGHISGWRRDVISVAGIGAIMVGLYQLPTDTALQEVRTAGRVSVCLPANLPPLVEDQGQAGYDVEVMREVARRMGVRFVPSLNTAIGRDFNPRNWRLSRAQCQVVAGGVMASPQVRSFMETLELPQEVGWALLGAPSLEAIGTQPLGIYPGLGGFDRLKISKALQDAGLDFTLYDSEQAAQAALENGTITVLLSDNLTANRLASATRPAQMLSDFEHYPLALGLWRGDVSLLKEIASHLEAMAKDGTLAAIYGSKPNKSAQ